MNSVEALVELIVEAKSLNRNDSRLSFLRNEIEKDLEILKILKEYIKIDDCKFDKDNKVKKCIIMFIPEMVEDYRVIKDWLENE